MQTWPGTSICISWFPDYKFSFLRDLEVHIWDGNFGQNVSLFRCRSISSTNPGQISNLTTQSLHLMCLVQIMTAEDKGILGVGWPCHQFCPLSVFCKSESLQRCISAAMAPSSCVDNRLRGTKIMTQIIYEIFFLLSMFVHGQKIFVKKSPNRPNYLFDFPIIG